MRWDFCSLQYPGSCFKTLSRHTTLMSDLLCPWNAFLQGGLKTTVENPRGSVEKLSSKESVEGAHTVQRGSVRAPEENPKGALTLPRSTVKAPEELSWGRSFLHITDPRIINSWSDYQNHEVHLRHISYYIEQLLSAKLFRGQTA